LEDEENLSPGIICRRLWKWRGRGGRRWLLACEGNSFFKLKLPTYYMPVEGHDFHFNISLRGRFAYLTRFAGYIILYIYYPASMSLMYLIKHFSKL
jgi:hypothetical protein